MNSPKDARERYSTEQLAAAEWLMSRESGLTAEQESLFRAWLATPGHARAFAELEKTWDALDRVRELPQASEAPDPDALASRRIRVRSTARRASFPAWWRGVAAAAAVILALGYGWRQLPLDRDYRDVAVTEIGAMRKLSLPDGSMVRLNTDSAVEIDYSATTRRVTLVRGEAHFAVAKNPARPFLVTAGGVDVRAVGTAFNVRMRSDAVEVLVTEGRVSVTDAVKRESLLAPETPYDAVSSSAPPAPPPERVMRAGERASVVFTSGRVPLPTAPMPLAPAEMERSLAWQDRQLRFAAVPLAEMVAEFNRYNRHKLVVADDRLAARRFGGVFRADAFETLVHLLETNHDVVVERRENETVLSLAP